MRTTPYEKDTIAKVVQLYANMEGLKLGKGVLERLAQKGHDSSLWYVFYNLWSTVEAFDSRSPRYALQLLTPASILAGIAGRKQIELEDIDEMGELFLDAKTSTDIIRKHQDGEAS